MNSTQHDVVLPEAEDYRAEIERMIRETQYVVDEMIGYIERQEDGPLTMRCALREMEQKISAIKIEAQYMAGSLNKLQTIAGKLMEQRDEAIRQRDLLMLVAWSDFLDPESNPPAQEP